MATSAEELSILGQRAQALQQYQDSHMNLLTDLYAFSQKLELKFAQETRSLKKALQEAELDLVDARNSRREHQQKAQDLQEQLQRLDVTNSQNSHPYVAVLIDGDGCLFQNHYIEDGNEGGKSASYAMRAAIIEKCQLTPKTDIVVKICANQGGLATALRQSGSINNEQTFRQFCIGFTQSKASFDYVDVGPGKERADAKIRESARWHLNNANCKMVILGISHDSGYAPFIDELHSTTDARNRLHILEGFPTVRELKAFGLPTINLNDTVFRDDKIVVDRTNSGFGNSNGHKAASNGAVTPPEPVQAPVYAPNSPPGPRPSEVPKEKTKKITTPNSSYATTAVIRPGGAPGPPPMKFPAATVQRTAAAIATATAKAMKKSEPAWSPGPRGLDQPVTFVPTYVDSVKKRKGAEKFCNTFVLCGYCTKDYCEYNHKLKASPEEKKALAFLMRQSPCTFGQECSNDDCIYGHNCPSVINGNCMQPYCRFPSKLHPPKTKFKQPFFGDD